jgi:hypothetical protein
MRKALIYLLLPILCATASIAAAQSPDAAVEGIPTDRWIHMDGEFMRKLQKRDSILIGDQMEYGFRLEGLEDGSVLVFPKLDDSFLEQITEWDSKILDRRSQGKGRPDLLDIEASITVAAFEEGDYILPPIIIGRVSPSGQVDTLYFDPIDTIKVMTVPMDTATFVRHGMKDIIAVPYNWEEFLYDLNKLWNHIKEHLLVWLILGKWLIILAGVGYCIWRIIEKKVEPVNAYVNEPAHIVALRKLDGLRSNAMWVPERQKAFYSGLTDALREYISRRYGIGALEMTTAELFDEMKVTDLSVEQPDELHDLFVRADFVKFAKYVASDEDNAATVPVAVRFVTQSYQDELAAKQEQVDEDVEMKK